MAPALVAVGACTPSALAVRPPNPPIVVTNTNDSGAGSLRAAVAQANVVVGSDTITFAIPGLGGQVITPLSDLPAITERVTIDGYTQSGAARATETTLADLKVVIDAQNLSVGLDLQGNGSHIRGLVIHSAAVAGSTADAIRITGDANRVTGNYLGTGAAGLVPLLNDQGVQIDGDNNIVGGTGPAERNVIGADLDCVIVVGGSGNQILGNRIGTNAAGTATIPNGLGMNIEGGDNNQIGGAGTGDGNVLAGNDFGGIQLEPGLDGAADGNVLEGNMIGTNAAGTAALPNGVGFALPGVLIVNSSDNVIGGSEPGAANVISANEGAGVHILGTTSADGNTILGNKIGTDITGALALGNGEIGVHIDGGDANQVGDQDPAQPINTIAFNGEDGVTIESGTGNAISRNSIFLNGGLGIDLDNDGVSVNDAAPDADAGANDLQNHPVITSAGTIAINWTLESLPSTEIRIEFYSSVPCDREGRTFRAPRPSSPTPLARPSGRPSPRFCSGPG